MNREQIFRAVGDIDDRYVVEAMRLAPEDTFGSPERVVYMKKKRIISFALAAALIFALGAVAYAYSMGIHRQRQAELRESMGIGPNGAPAYVEYEAPEGNTVGVTLLSAVNDGHTQRIFLDVSPVTRDDLAPTQNPVLFSLDGGETWEQAMTAGDESRAYDAESQTLTVVAMIPTDGRQPGEELNLLFKVNDHLDCGSIDLKLTHPDTCYIELPQPVEVLNPGTGDTLRLLAVELRGAQAVWTMETDRAETALEASWLNGLDDLFRAMTLHLSDGESCSFTGVLFYDAEGTVLYPHVDYDRGVIDTAQVQSIVINGETIKLR